MPTKNAVAVVQERKVPPKLAICARRRLVRALINHSRRGRGYTHAHIQKGHFIIICLRIKILRPLNR